MDRWMCGWIDSFCSQMDGWMESVSLRYRKEGWMDEWISVSLR